MFSMEGYSLDNSISTASDSPDSIQTFSISSVETTQVFLSSSVFQNYVSGGSFVSVDDHLVIDDPLYVIRDDKGFLQLTDYARSTIDDCCLRFEVLSRKVRSKVEYAWIDLTTDQCSDTLPVFKPDDHNQKIFEKSRSTLSFLTLTEEFKEFNLHTAGLDFAQTVYAHIKRLKISQRLFSEKTLLDDRAFRKIKSGNWKNPTFDAVMAICVGLALGTHYGLPLLKKAGYTLDRSDRTPYEILLACFCGHSIFECNRHLAEFGAPLLREREYHAFVGS